MLCECQGPGVLLQLPSSWSLKGGAAGADLLEALPHQADARPMAARHQQATSGPREVAAHHVHNRLLTFLPASGVGGPIAWKSRNAQSSAEDDQGNVCATSRLVVRSDT